MAKTSDTVLKGFGSPEFLAQPAPLLGELREAGGLARIKVPIIGTCWATTSDAAARALLKDEARFARNPANAGGRDTTRMYWWMPRSLRPLLRTLLAQDGADHMRLRKAVDRAFARVSIEEMKPHLEAIADDLLTRLPTDQPVDLVSTYARPLPLQAICALLGIAPDLRKDLSRAIAPISGPTGIWTMLRGMPGLKKANALLLREMDRHANVTQTEPGLLPALVRESDLTTEEILGMAFMLFVAGHETTLHLISTSLYSLSHTPELRGQALTNPAAFTEEMLRVHSPVMMTKPLFVREDTEFEGQHLKQGEKIIALLIAANYDPARFDDAHALHPQRRPNAHLAFGFGPHVCLGMQLARAETQIALTQIVQRFPNMRPAAPNAPPHYAERFGLRGLKTLDVILGDPS